MAIAHKNEVGNAPIPAKASKKVLIIAIATVLLVLILGGSAAVLLLRTASHEDGDAVTSAAKGTQHGEPPIFVRLEPFTVKLQADQEGQEHYLQLLPEIKVLSAQVSDKIKAYMPEIRDRMLLVLMAQKASGLSTPQGIDKLAGELRNTANEIIDGQAKTPLPADRQARPDDSIQEVVFTSFIVQ